MSSKTTLALALAAGFIGGIASQHILPPLVFAQAPTVLPKELRAQNFVLTDENGTARGAFGFDKKGEAGIEIINQGHVYWVRWGEPLFGKGKPTLVPLQ
jgi:hypothetical protein